MKLSDCCGASPDGIEGAEETGICPQCHEHCEFVDDEPELVDLGCANGWPNGGESPEIVKKCQALGHNTMETRMPGGDWRVVCATCGYECRYDSGD